MVCMGRLSGGIDTCQVCTLNNLHQLPTFNQCLLTFYRAIQEALQWLKMETTGRSLVSLPGEVDAQAEMPQESMQIPMVGFWGIMLQKLLSKIKKTWNLFSCKNLDRLHRRKWVFKKLGDSGASNINLIGKRLCIPRNKCMKYKTMWPSLHVFPNYNVSPTFPKSLKSGAAYHSLGFED